MPQTAKTYQISAQSSVDYLLYLPEDFQGSRTYPLILFLHGSGERGNDINLVRKYGLPLLLDQPAAHPYAAQFIVVSPQCPADIRWIERSAILDALLAHVQETLPIDPTRIYSASLSMGAQGTWYYAAEHPTQFAALVPICGRIPPQAGWPGKVCALKDVPIWVFHGALDNIVPVENSEILVRTLRECGADVRYTVFPDADHFSWDRVFTNPDVYTWLLSHCRSLEG